MGVFWWWLGWCGVKGPARKGQQVGRCEQCVGMDGYVRQGEKSRRVAGVIRLAGWL